jgi:hypothetical protein
MNHPETFRVALPFLLASIVFHYDWLTERDVNGNYVNISSNHKFFTSRLFTSGLCAELKKDVLGINVTGKCEATGMTATGVPQSV